MIRKRQIEGTNGNIRPPGLQWLPLIWLNDSTRDQIGRLG